jgi:hypothetical protein
MKHLSINELLTKKGLDQFEIQPIVEFYDSIFLAHPKLKLITELQFEQSDYDKYEANVEQIEAEIANPTPGDIPLDMEDLPSFHYVVEGKDADGKFMLCDSVIDHFSRATLIESKYYFDDLVQGDGIPKFNHIEMDIADEIDSISNIPVNTDIIDEETID